MERYVKHFMTGGPISIERDAPALAALDLMLEHGFRHLPVLDAQRSLIGVVSFDDLRAALPFPLSLSNPPPPEARAGMLESRVDDIMSDPIVARTDTPLAEAVRLIVEHAIGCLPVVDDEGRLVGLLSERDLLKTLMTVLWTDSLPDRRGGEMPVRQDG